MISVLSTIDTSSSNGKHESFAFVAISITVMIIFIWLIGLILLVPKISLLVSLLHYIDKSGKWAILLIGVQNILTFVISFTKYTGGDIDLMDIYFVIKLIVIFSLVIFSGLSFCVFKSHKPGPNELRLNLKEMDYNYENSYYSNFRQQNPYQN